MREDYELIEEKHLPKELKETGGIAYLKGGKWEEDKVVISHNVAEEDRKYWARHEWECFPDLDINACMKATKQDLEYVLAEQGKRELPGFMARRARMLHGVLKMNLAMIEGNPGNHEGLINSVRTTLKVMGSLNLLQSNFGENAEEVIGKGIFQDLEQEENILQRYGHLVIGVPQNS